MPIIPKKRDADTAKCVTAPDCVSSGDMPNNINDHDTHFALLVASYKKIRADELDRHTAAAILDTSIRTLQRWHRECYGPKRRKSIRGRICYSKAEVLAWIAKHGRECHGPRTPKAGAHNSSGEQPSSRCR
jgi:hypothetical protein